MFALASLGKSRYFPLSVAALAVLLALPSLRTGLVLDDYYHKEVLRPVSAYRELLGPPSEMFRFFRGDPVRTGRIMDIGAFPWWTDPTLKAEFLQAMTVLTHRLDYALWPDSPALMHAQSLFWLGAAVAAAAVFYRRMLGATWVAAVAALVVRGGRCAGRDRRVHCQPQRPDRGDVWRLGTRLPRPLPARWLAPGGGPGRALARPCALLQGGRDRNMCVSRRVRLVPGPEGRLARLPVDDSLRRQSSWPGAVVRDSWGYGVHNMGLYVDPLTDPGPFAAGLAERLPLLLLGQWGPIPAETAVMLRPPLSSAFWWSAVVFIGLVIFAVAPLLKRDRLARFWFAGMLFAAIPVCATLPMDRLLTFAGIGAFGLLAQFWAFVFGDRAMPRRTLGGASPLVRLPGSSWPSTRFGHR